MSADEGIRRLTHSRERWKRRAFLFKAARDHEVLRREVAEAKLAAADQERHDLHNAGMPTDHAAGVQWIERLIAKCERVDQIARERDDARRVLNADLKTASDRVLTLELENQELERKYRTRLWLGHGHSTAALYGDDGEMQCNHHECMIDFKREPLERIEERLAQLQLKRAAQSVTREQT